VKKLKIRRPDQCRDCGSELPAGAEVWWDAAAKSVHCLTCVGASDATTPDVEEPAAVEPADDDVAGRSARQIYERRAARDEAKAEKAIAEDRERRREIVEKRPVLGRISNAMTAKPTKGPPRQTTTAWKTGAEGEERVAEVLAGVPGIEVLHDRQVPGSRANIDHLAVGPAGVFVIDAKKYGSSKKEPPRIEVRDVGGLFRTDERLYVGGRDRTELVEGVLGQIDVVRTALGPEFEAMPVHGVLCFIGGTWGWRLKMKQCRGVFAIWPVGLTELVTSPGPHAADVDRIADHLRTVLKSAG
jgi:hypothetical protein